jgi:predicted Holliday junction resolvase-like endonuclease
VEGVADLPDRGSLVGAGLREDGTISPTDTLVAALAAVNLGMLLAILWQRRRLAAMHGELEEERTRKKSLSAVYGRITEQWIPLSNRYPHDPRHFRFLGTPVDGVQFTEDAVIFVEFKMNRSRLSENQQRIKALVEEGRVFWEEYQFTDEG